MKIVLIGGRLQGVEAVYLAKMLGWESVVLDLDPSAPASELCTQFVQGDAMDEDILQTVCQDADLVLPTIEKQPVLDMLANAAAKWHLPLVYDVGAYHISSSKRRSDQLFADAGIPAPKPWPACGFPVVCKPSEGSGSQGVRIVRSGQDLCSLPHTASAKDMVWQQYLPGPSYSIEVIGDGHTYEALQITQLFVDRDYDCKRVLAPSGLSPQEEAQFRSIALRIAAQLEIRGIFDVEAIYHRGEFCILEIDARLPSQTPTTVLHSSGVNLLERLCRIQQGRWQPIQAAAKQACLYEHIHVRDGIAVPCGEHVMGQLGPLQICDGWMGADRALISDMQNSEWAATLIYTGTTRRQVLQKHRETLQKIRAQMKVAATV